MASFSDVWAESAPPGGGARGLIRWVCTSNPFYVLSAGLFLLGLWISFGAQAEAVQTWALMSGLAGYTLLLAGTAFLLVRYARVWDDVRTVLLLVVLMFLATSVTFDEVLVLDPPRGFACYLGGLALAVAVSEGLLRGIRLALPPWFRLPYYLILALFFLYPLALNPLLADPKSEVLMWGLFGFSPVAGLVFLTLLPAVRRGPEYVRDNGSPWRWPLYPGVLFGLLAFAVPARSFLLCWSMQLLDGGDRDRLIFGPYFLAPFGLCLAVLLLEIGLVPSRHPGVLGVALAVPAGLVVLSMVGHRPDPIYRAFLETFAARLGGYPLFLTLVAAVVFYAYASLRRAPLATEALTLALLALSVVAPFTLDLDRIVLPQPAPILAAGALQLVLGLWWRKTWRCLAGTAGVVAAVALSQPAGGAASLRLLLVFHLAVLALLVLGASFHDTLGRRLRLACAALVLLACLAATFGPLDGFAALPPWVVLVYPVVMAGLLAAYGRLLRHRPSLAAAGLALAAWLAAAGWRGYWSARQFVTGLDYLALSLALFALAVLISLGKSGLLPRWIIGRRNGVPTSAG